MRKNYPLIAMFSLAAIALGCNNNLEQGESFGKTTQFMVNGVADNSVAHKAVVSLYIRDANKACGSGDGSVCTGTLIHPQYVLTAAHCVAETKSFGNPYPSACSPFLHIGFGKNESEAASSLYDIENIYFPKDYKDVTVDSDYSTTTADIALIKLKKSVPASVAKPILTLPPWLGLSTQSLGKDGRNMEFSGFGYDENGGSGQKLKFTAKATAYCGGSNPSDDKPGCSMGSVKVNGCHPSPDICQDNGPVRNATEYVYAPYGSFYYSQDDGGPCQGDSGGPGFVTIGGIEYTASVTSYGDSICAVYGISTASQDFYSWMIGLAPELANIYVEVCNNGIDDTGNKLVDCKDPACASAPNCIGIVNEICNNGIDDDKNGKIDCLDSACVSAPNCTGIVTEICNNGIDDDKNGKIDCKDTACVSAPNCNTSLTEICDNGKDDDGDGLADCNDPFCDFAANCNPSVTEICDNGKDDDDDGFADCDDAYCYAAANCSENAVEICNNGKDDDNNKLADCNDPACADDAKCNGTGTQTCEVDEEGYIDCNDPACKSEFACIDSDFFENACSSTTKTHTSNPLGAFILTLMALFALVASRRTQSRKSQS